MHSYPLKKKMYFFEKVLGINTKFTRGGVNLYDKDMQIPAFLKIYNGFERWMGMGGSILQWHREKRIGFGYTCNYLEIPNKKISVFY